MAAPFVSIVVPVYNVGPYLTTCMNSLCNQTLKQIEIIAVNDKSDDHSGAILDSFAKNDPRIKVIHNQKNLKTASCRNIGLSIAKGEYVCFVDGDDFLDNDFCEKLYYLAKSKDADIAKGLTKTIHENGAITIANDNDEIRLKGKSRFWGHLLTAIYRQSFLKKHDIHFHIDFFCFQIQAVHYANRICCLDSVFYNYVRHPNSCDSDFFTLEKWLSLNVRHGNFIYQWLKKHEIDSQTRTFYLGKVKWLYFYGYNKLDDKNVLQGCFQLANILKNNYDCGFNVQNIKRLRRQLFRKHKRTTFFQYVKNRIMGVL